MRPIYYRCSRELFAKIVRIYHENDNWIEKSVLRITDWHHKACQMMANGDRQGQIFLSHPHMNHGFFFLLSLNTAFLYFKY